MNNNNESKEFLVLEGPIREIEVPEENPFLHDELFSEDRVKKLTNITKALQNGSVIAINGEWGTGKTTFVRMWKTYLDKEGFPVAYYNAWEDDISEEPLLSLLKQLRKVTNKKRKGLGKVLKTGAKILGRITIAGAKASMGKVSEIIINAGEESAKEIKKIIEEAGKGGLDAIQGAFEDSLKEKDDIQSLMKEFREAFQSYVEYDKSEERAAVPFVYFVDELDRCNPSFAVKVLERIKHLFEVPNVVFVLSVDMKQLALSINGYFGSERFNSIGYLNRFIDYEYNFHSTLSSNYCYYLSEKYGIYEIAKNNGFECFSVHLSLIEELALNGKLTLRQAEKIFMSVQLMLINEDKIAVREGELFTFIPICFFLSYIKICHYDIYHNIIDYRYTLEKLASILESLMPQKQLVVNGEHDKNFEHYSLCMFLILSHYCEDLWCVWIKNAEKTAKRLFDKKDRKGIEYASARVMGLAPNSNSTIDKLKMLHFNRLNTDVISENKTLFEEHNSRFGLNEWIERLEMSNIDLL